MKLRWLCVVTACLNSMMIPSPILVGQEPVGQSKERPDPNRDAASRPLSILEDHANWTSLFNGRDLEGWTGDVDGYVAEDGVLVCQKGGRISSRRKRSRTLRFNLSSSWRKVETTGSEFVFPPEHTPLRMAWRFKFLMTMAAAMWEQPALKVARSRTMSWLKPWQYHGSIYGIVPARPGYLKPVGQWNQQTILAIEDHVMVILNGAVIVDAFLDNVSPLDDTPRPGMKNASGHLVLAGHNDRVEFRKLRIADYSAPPSTLKSETDNTPPKGFQALFNGDDLTGWKGLAHKNANQRRSLSGDALAQAQETADELMRDHWHVVDGVLSYDGKGQSLCTAKNYGDFEFYVDWKIPPGADSGIYLRGTPQVQIWDPWDQRIRANEASPETSQQWVAAYTNGGTSGRADCGTTSDGATAHSNWLTESQVNGTPF